MSNNRLAPLALLAATWLTPANAYANGLGAIGVGAAIILLGGLAAVVLLATCAIVAAVLGRKGGRRGPVRRAIAWVCLCLSVAVSIGPVAFFAWAFQLAPLAGLGLFAAGALVGAAPAWLSIRAIRNNRPV
jgi:hypothetical protein